MSEKKQKEKKKEKEKKEDCIDETKKPNHTVLVTYSISVKGKKRRECTLHNTIKPISIN